MMRLLWIRIFRAFFMPVKLRWTLNSFSRAHILRILWSIFSWHLSFNLRVFYEFFAFLCLFELRWSVREWIILWMLLFVIRIYSLDDSRECFSCEIFCRVESDNKRFRRALCTLVWFSFNAYFLFHLWLRRKTVWEYSRLLSIWSTFWMKSRYSVNISCWCSRYKILRANANIWSYCLFSDDRLHTLWFFLVLSWELDSFWSLRVSSAFLDHARSMMKASNDRSLIL
jgi:hypothetical protein